MPSSKPGSHRNILFAKRSTVDTYPTWRRNAYPATQKAATAERESPTQACYHAVKGQYRFGMIFDPGAPDALAGAQTILEYQKHVLDYLGEYFTSEPVPESGFRGIDGEALPSKYRVTLPISLGGAPLVDWSCATIGSTGDCCPMLFSNGECLRRKTLTVHPHFDNGDGLLIFPHLFDRPLVVRVLLSDSGHYVIPLDEQLSRDTDMHYTVGVTQAKDKLVAFVSSYLALQGSSTQTFGYIDDPDPHVHGEESPELKSELKSETQSKSESHHDAGASDRPVRAEHNMEPPPGLEDAAPDHEVRQITSVVCKTCGIEHNTDSCLPCIRCLSLVCTQCSKDGLCPQ